jgi:multidrug efflux pump subunit AcrA (membrane-fusion protein)
MDMKKNFFSKLWTKIMLGLILLGIAGGTYYFVQLRNQPAETETPAVQTTKVRKGDLVISANGTGTVYPAAQVDLGFKSNGVISEVYVSPNQKVIEGDVLASLENAAQVAAFAEAEANLNNLFSPAGIAAYQIEVVNAEIEYNEALGQSYTLNRSIGSSDSIAILQAAYLNAQEKVALAEEKLLGFSGYPDDDINKVNATAALAAAKLDLSSASANLNYYKSAPDELTAATILANVEITKAKLDDARVALDILQSGDKTRLTESLSAVDNTLLARVKNIYLDYENARISLENTRMVAPFDGVVVNIDMVPGQVASGNSLLTLAALDTLQVNFYMDETDLAGLMVGNRVVYTFNAYPESSISGEVTLIESVLQNFDGSPAAVVWGSITEEASFNILAGMTVDVEVIAGEVQGGLIIPVQALRELTPGSYAVFLVKPDGTLELTPVSVGLRDFANAEITAGLKAGDIVSTGTIETNDGN